MAQQSKKKEHSAKKDHKFFNSLTFEWLDGRWECPGLQERAKEMSETMSWEVYVIAVELTHLGKLIDTYGPHKLWNMAPEIDGILKSVRYSDGFFLRWWLDQYVLHTSDEIWNLVYESVRHAEPGKTNDRLGETEAAKEVEKWQAMVM